MLYAIQQRNKGSCITAKDVNGFLKPGSKNLFSENNFSIESGEDFKKVVDRMYMPVCAGRKDDGYDRRPLYR